LKEIVNKIKKEFKNDESFNEYINFISKSLTVYAFRNGPVEDMHAEGKLSEEDMQILNKYMVEKLAEYFAVFSNSYKESGKAKEAMIFMLRFISPSGWDDVTLDNLENILSHANDLYESYRF